MNQYRWTQYGMVDAKEDFLKTESEQLFVRVQDIGHFFNEKQIHALYEGAGALNERSFKIVGEDADRDREDADILREIANGKN